MAPDSFAIIAAPGIPGPAPFFWKLIFTTLGNRIVSETLFRPGGIGVWMRRPSSPFRSVMAQLTSQEALISCEWIKHSS